MKLAYSTNAYRRFELNEALVRIAALGYRGVEIMADTPHLWPAAATDAQIHGVRRWLDEYELSISNVNAFMMNEVQDFWHPSWIEPDTGFRRLRIQHTLAALELAAMLGAPSISTEPGGPLPKGMSREQAMARFTEGLKEALRVAEEKGVMLLIEPEPGLLIENSRQFLQLAERVDSPMFGLNFDVGHLYCVGEDVPNAVRALQRFTRHYHFEDIAATRVHEHLIPGRGAIDFAAVLPAIRATGFPGWLTVELYPYLEDPDAAGREALSYLTPLVTP